MGQSIKAKQSDLIDLYFSVINIKFTTSNVIEGMTSSLIKHGN